MEIIKADRSRFGQTDFEKLGWGEVFSDHMFSMDYKGGKWASPRIHPFGNLEISPAMCSLHYAQIIFEGLKAFHTKSGAVNIFRPDKHHERLNRSCRRLCIPDVEYDSFISAVTQLIELDKKWIPKSKGASLYIRPMILATDIGLGVKVSETYRYLIFTTPVAAYYKEGMNPIKLTTPQEYIRAAKGGLGEAKTPGNYAATLLPSENAKKEGFTQVLWLDGIEHKYVEEVGTMNICFVIEDELVTPELGGTILPGITRDSVIHIARDWGIKVVERKISIEEVFSAAKFGKLKEVFGTGTAVVISPVGEIHHNKERIVINKGRTGELALKLYEEITGIQYGEKQDKFGWCYKI
jgi:branched-chain amino acid aminotransferase